jgi:hypothetical protein
MDRICSASAVTRAHAHICHASLSVPYETSVQQGEKREEDPRTRVAMAMILMVGRGRGRGIDQYEN